MSTLERCWIAYCAVVITVAFSVDGGGHPGCRPYAFAAVHAAIAALQLVPAWGRRRWQPGTVRGVQAVLACAGLPVVFSSLAWLLPHVHPEPYEFAWYRVDVMWFGADSTGAVRALLPAGLAVLLQLVYAAFYFVPIAALLAVRRVSGTAAFDRALTILVGGFLCSYLGYLWFPTLAPKLVLPAERVDLVAVSGLRDLIDRAETNPWDCFPSGHTMLSLISAMVVWRWARRWLPVLLAVVAPLIASTMLLRYHWPIDVAVGAALAWPCMRAIDMALDRDGAAPVSTASVLVARTGTEQ